MKKFIYTLLMMTILPITGYTAIIAKMDCLHFQEPELNYSFTMYAENTTDVALNMNYATNKCSQTGGVLVHIYTTEIPD